jgi:S-methylmethionine-dependent homocysteine/selenocysteine methylase|tara:strand:+ start:1861 stop:2043 length:183 start_codon:yes stop_codon:yes gene_type:complete
MSATKSDTSLLPEITLLDGGMGQELLKRSSQDITPLCSTQVIDFKGAHYPYEVTLYAVFF